MKPILFILNMPFEDGSGTKWFCSHCALIEGALMVNPHWADHVDIRHIDYPRPRKEVIEILGEENQWLPALVLNNHQTINDPIEIARYLAGKYGGAAPHP